MKNQYVADINDYRKYGLLRALIRQGVDNLSLRLGVCWMRTPDDSSTHGNLRRYLENADQWCRYDKGLFHKLKTLTHGHRPRTIDEISRLGILPGARFVTDDFPDSREEREAVVQRTLEALAECDLVFFDPDNGLEIPSKPLGRKRSSKYLYYHEAARAYCAGHSLLVYQHFPFEKRVEYVKRRMTELSRETRASHVKAIVGPHACFFLVSQAVHLQTLHAGLEAVRTQWAGQLRVQED
jgi:hypothetical protein